MLVFLSDIHLTDGSSGETIKAGAFEKFGFYLEAMAQKAKAEFVEIVLLGDIFDIIRSDFWLNGNNYKSTNRKNPSVRPWSETTQKDKKGLMLKDYTLEIVKRICNNPINKESASHLSNLKEKMFAKGVQLKFTYIIGNHDWLLNRYPETRIQIAKFLNMDNPQQYKNARFLTEQFWPDYRVFGRHGDIYDDFNFDEDRDSSSLGDAIVIDLLNNFPTAVEKAIGKDADQDLISYLKEIDNVRPLSDIPMWVVGACRNAKTKEISVKVKEVWNRLADDFLKIPFVREHDKPWRPDIVDALQVGLRLSKYLSFQRLSKLPLAKFAQGSDDFAEHAFEEPLIRRNEAEFVVYGHTHKHVIQPLDFVPTESQALQKTYFNTGTWRKIHRRVLFDHKNLEFFSWHVMTFIAFYLSEERKNRRFEVWSGALG